MRDVPQTQTPSKQVLRPFHSFSTSTCINRIKRLFTPCVISTHYHFPKLFSLKNEIRAGSICTFAAVQLKPKIFTIELSHPHILPGPIGEKSGRSSPLDAESHKRWSLVAKHVYAKKQFKQGKVITLWEVPKWHRILFSPIHRLIHEYILYHPFVTLHRYLDLYVYT